MKKTAVSMTLSQQTVDYVKSLMESIPSLNKSEAIDLISFVVQCEVDIDTILYYYSNIFKR